jgi:hypothetical protein
LSTNQFGVSLGNSLRQPSSSAGATTASNNSAVSPMLSAVACTMLRPRRRASAAMPSRSAG